ncbi:ATPase family AAA domain-containing protein 1 [Armadillidium nasatum]|uniref:ATPase family AAA domain-containing protein 1 n=1 Tax=Armadillidium nasatum TaxID=96803 RepID=A0A5N5TLY1_9CRUS|nr:ATPase family AAA domain-containing protein 1 [Armadillidium nasatum]
MPPKGILLYGPPGCGKTMIAKAMCVEIDATFINFDISAIRNKYVGETEKMATALFMKVLDGYPLSQDVSLEELAEKTENFSGADLRELCRYAALFRLSDYLEQHGGFNKITSSKQVMTFMEFPPPRLITETNTSQTITLSDELLSSIKEEIDILYDRPKLRSINMTDLLKALEQSRLNANSKDSFPKDIIKNIS